MEHRILLSELRRGFPQPAYTAYAKDTISTLSRFGPRSGPMDRFEAMRERLLRYDEYAAALPKSWRARYVLLKRAPMLFRLAGSTARALRDVARKAKR